MKTNALKTAGLLVALAMITALPLSAQSTTGGRLNIHGTTTTATPTEGTTTIHTTTTATPRTTGTKKAVVRTTTVKAKPAILATKPD